MKFILLKMLNLSAWPTSYLKDYQKGKDTNHHITNLENTPHKNGSTVDVLKFQTPVACQKV